MALLGMQEKFASAVIPGQIDKSAAWYGIPLLVRIPIALFVHANYHCCSCGNFIGAKSLSMPVAIDIEAAESNAAALIATLWAEELKSIHSSVLKGTVQQAVNGLNLNRRKISVS
ncbi:hypothetical protein BVC80_1195g6 [Macleaya cordata]|uniref:Uncharacterized protein n=1 Tax=Macleaya cordata TaxID=56857 RepID=A0A200RCE1_MACCD|nr:hypothetical protein BVC80_1195g6 [Macleaya cordata]